MKMNNLRLSSNLSAKRARRVKQKAELKMDSIKVKDEKKEGAVRLRAKVFIRNYIITFKVKK